MSKKMLNNLQEAIIYGDIDRVIDIADYNRDGDGGICTAQVPIKIKYGKEHIADFYIDGILFDGDMEECIFNKNNYEYMLKTDLISWSDIVKITSEETGKVIYVPVAEKEEFETPDDYLVIAFAEENIEDIKDGRVLYEDLVINNEYPKIKWAFLEDEFQEFDEFKKFILENTMADIDNKIKSKLDLMSDDEICQTLKKYLTNRKYMM